MRDEGSVAKRLEALEGVLSNEGESENDRKLCDTALGVLAEARTLPATHEARDLLRRALVTAGAYCRRTNRLDDAVALYTELVSFSKCLSSSAEQLSAGGGARMWLARLALERDNVRTARERLSELLALCDQMEDTMVLAQVMSLEASVLLCTLSLRDGDKSGATAALERVKAGKPLLGTDPHTISTMSIVTEFAQDRFVTMAVEAGVTLSGSGSYDSAAKLLETLADWATRCEQARAKVTADWAFALIAQRYDPEAALNASLKAGFALDKGELDHREASAAGDIYRLTGCLADYVGDHGLAVISHERAFRHRSRVYPASDLRVLTSRYDRAEVARASGDAARAATALAALADELRDDERDGVAELRELVLKNLVAALEGLGKTAEADRVSAEFMSLGPRDDLREQMLVYAATRRRRPDERRELERDLRAALARLPIKASDIDSATRGAHLLGGFARVVASRDEAYEAYTMAIQLLSGVEVFNARFVRCDNVMAFAHRLISDGHFDGALSVLSQTLPPFVQLAMETWRVRSPFDTQSWNTAWRAMWVWLVARHFPEDQKALNMAFATAVSGKSAQAEALVFQREVAPRDATGEVDLNELVNDLRRRKAWDKTMTVDEHHSLRQLEAGVARSVSPTAYLLSFNRSRPNSVASALPTNSVVVEYFRFHAAFEAAQSEWYAAFTLSVEGKVSVHFLGPAEPIDHAAEELRAAVEGEGSAGASWRSRARALARLIWDPVEECLRNAHWTFVAPAGPLALVPFDALIDSQGVPLIRTCTLILLGTSRDAHRFRGHRSPPKEPLVMAPEFGPPDHPFASLPGAIGEAHAIARILGVQPQIGPQATREALLNCRDPEILHLATHGYAGYDTSAEPLLACGVALGGANAFLSGQSDRIGVVTALDALGIDLGETDLVVLSSCESGVGAPKDHEGLISLARSFVLAGARAVVWSLWRVDDASTARTMTRMYSALLNGKPKAHALREAKLAALAEHPERIDIWAAWTIQGDPMPLLRHRALEYVEDVPAEDLALWQLENP